MDKPSTKPLSIYVHWPFCLSKCPYCDFNSHVSDSINHDRWLTSFKAELSYFKRKVEGDRVVSIFFGGGTPSLMKPSVVEGILSHIHDLWDVEENCEITFEANPTSIESHKFKAFRDAGINRVSIGIQALNDDDLKFLGRQHSAKEALEAVDIADKIFARRSIDLIYARPNQSLKAWEGELTRALSVINGHASLYQLTIEQGTPFYTSHKRGDFAIPSGDEGADLYDLTQEMMEAARMPAYEVSNHAVEGQESAHNLTYWRYGDYVGVGPGAHGRVTIDGQKHATRIHCAPDIWLERVTKDQNGLQACDALSRADQNTEALMMGIRLSEGVSIEGMLLDQAKLNTLVQEEDITLDGDILKATRKGRLRLNSLLSYLLSS